MSEAGPSGGSVEHNSEGEGPGEEPEEEEEEEGDVSIM